jgi:gas vesicle protein
LVEVFMHSLKYVGIALTAGIVGAAVALLIAPQSGRETRRKLGRRFEEESRRMSRTLQNEKENLMKKGREALDDVAEYVNDELNAAQKKISKMVQA